MQLSIRLTIMAACLILFNGCGMTVQQRIAVRQFAAGTTDFASLARSELIQSRRDVIEMNRMRVLLGDDSVAHMDGHFTHKNLELRLHVLDGLNRYGELLQILLSTSSPADLKSSAEDFVSSMNGIEGVNISDADKNILGKLVTIGGGFLVEHKRANAIKKTIEFAHPHVIKAVDLVEKDFDPNNDLWNAGYRHAVLDLEGAITDVQPLATKDLASEQALRSAQLVADESKSRFELVSKRIIDAAKQLERAEADLRVVMVRREINFADIQAYRNKVNELKILLELVRPQKANDSQ